jgi:hypothetical protein
MLDLAQSDKVLFLIKVCISFELFNGFERFVVYPKVSIRNGQDYCRIKGQEVRNGPGSTPEAQCGFDLFKRFSFNIELAVYISYNDLCSNYKGIPRPILLLTLVAHKSRRLNSLLHLTGGRISCGVP